jgi:hypothetical protein
MEPIGAKNYEFINPFVIDPNTNNQMYLPEGTKLHAMVGGALARKIELL